MKKKNNKKDLSLVDGDGVLPKVTLYPIDSHKTMYYIYLL